ncbi:hypothetical protein LP415_12735 [Polaromonas sp. P1(28)-8]|nr:hypothetical protein LP415_12735 [Polaromonas sp. P1(28)-8]
MALFARQPDAVHPGHAFAAAQLAHQLVGSTRTLKPATSPKALRSMAMTAWPVLVVVVSS